MEQLKYQNKWLHDFDCVIGGLFYFVMVVLLFAQVVTRTVHISAPWTEELAIICFILANYFGACGAIEKKKHLQMDIFVGRLPLKAQKIFEIISNFLFIAFCIIISYGLLGVTQNFKKFGLKTPVLQLPKWIFYGLLVLIFILMIVKLIYVQIRSFQELNKMEADQTIANDGKEP